MVRRPPRRLPELQEFKKICIVEAKGYCYGWHFYQAGDADLVISSDDALFGHAAFRYAGYAPRMWWWAQIDGPAQVPGDGLHRPARSPPRRWPSAASSTASCPATSSRPRSQKYALACAQNRPTDVVFMQKTFFEIMKQHQGEYMGSLLSAMLESMASLRPKTDAGEADDDTNETIDAGLTKAVKDFDSRFPPEWRLSK